MFYLAGICISFFLGALLWTKKNKSLADKVLATWLMVVGLHLLQFYLYISGHVFDQPWLLGIALPFPLLHGPFLYLYVCTLSEQIQRLSTKTFLHFIPAVAEFIYLIPFMLRPTEEKIYVFQNDGIGYELFRSVHIVIVSLSGIVYVIWCLIVLRQHKRNIMNQFSDIEKINLHWLRYLIYSIALIWLFVLLHNDPLIYSAAVLFVLFIGYWGMHQVGVFTQKNAWPPEEKINVNVTPSQLLETIATSAKTHTEDSNAPKRKYSRSGLSAEAAKELHKKLTELMIRDKPFKENGLTLAELAARLDTVPNYLSQVINEKEGKNFFDYINIMRVEEFKKMASTPDGKKYTLLALAYDCGFNSKSSFNKYFKKVTGLSPSEYFR